jgi:hypothetical protein
MSNLGNEIENIVAAIRATPGWRIEDGRHWKAFAPDRKTLVII